MVTRLVAWFRPRGAWDWLAMLMTTLAFTLAAYWAVVDRQPIGESESAILTPVVEPGGTFTIRYHVRWNSACKVTGYRFVIDSAGQQYTIAPDQRYVHPFDKPEFLINIPIALAARPGPAVYRATVIYECNPLQRLFPLETQIADRHFTIAVAGAMLPAPTVACSEERPVFVRAHCRALPGQAASRRP